MMYMSTRRLSGRTLIAMSDSQHLIDEVVVLPMSHLVRSNDVVMQNVFDSRLLLFTLPFSTYQ